MAKSKTSMQKNSAGNLPWFRNVAKSLGYTSTELITRMAPSIGEFTASNIEYGQDLVNDFREMKSSGQKFSKLFKDNQQWNIANTALKNAMEDIKSGKIYNKERQDSLYADDEFDMADFSFDGDGGGFSFDSDEGSPQKAPTINIKTMAPPITRNNPMVKAVERQSEVTLRASRANMEAQASIATNQMMLSQKIGTGTLKGLETINDNLALLVNFQSESMGKYVGASLKYYEDSLSTLKSTLDEIKKTTANIQPQRQNMRSSDPMDDIFFLNGGLNVKGYMNQIKKNFTNQLSSNMFLQPLKMMFEDTDTLKMLAASPLSFISTKMVTTLIPQFLQSSIQNLDKSFSQFFPAMVMKINRLAASSSNPIMQLVGEIFGAAARSKSTVDLSKYNRGQIPFDGETKKSIVEVIPGYLRKILAAVSGGEELAYDYDKGKFSTVSKMKENFDKERDGKVLNVYSEAIEDIKRRSEAFVMQSETERKSFNDGVNKFFLELAKQGHLVNPNLRKDKNGNVRDELAEVFDFNDKGMLKLFRQLILTMPKNEQMKMFGRNVIDARRNVKEMMEMAEDNPNRFNAATLFNEMGFDEHLKKGKNGSKEVKKGFGLFNPADKFGMTTLDYMRDIKRILLEGIRVFPHGGMGGGSGDPDDLSQSTMSKYDKQRQHMNDQARKMKEKQQQESARKYKDFKPEQIMKFAKDGKMVINGAQDLTEMSDEAIANQLGLHDSARKDDQKVGQQKSITQWLGKFFRGDKQDKYNLLREQIDNMLQKPAKLMQSVFDRIDSTLYGVVFGSPGKNGETSFMERTMASLRESFGKLGDFVKDKVFQPIQEAFVGKNGIITKMKDSDLYKTLMKKGKKLGDTLFGEMGEDGKRVDGMFAQSGNAMLDVWDGFRYYFTGKEYTNRAGVKFANNEKDSVFGEVKGMMRNFSKDMKSYFVGDKKAEDPDNQKGVLTGAIDGIKEGFHNWRTALFGPKGMTKQNSKQSFDEMMKTVKQRAPKALAWGTIGGGVGLATALTGGAGLLGSLILPGGPIGAAVVGTSIGFLSQSEKFKTWMFGEKNINNERIGGIIGKSTQDFFKKNRVAIMGGATIGALKPILGMGILPSFLLPGGPIAGAMMGIGAAMIMRSEGFQKVMFGEKDENGKRMGGFVQKAFGKFKTNKDNFKGLGGNMAVGALGGAGIAAVVGKMGIMGAMLTPAGPIGGAVLGAAAGIALSSDRWKKALFGEWDENTGLRKGGLLGKFTNWFGLEVMHPLKNQLSKINLNMQEWFTTKISNPFIDAIAPMKLAFKNMTDTLTDYFKKGWEGFKDKIGTVFEENVGKPFGRFMNENVMKPLRGFLMKLITGVGRIFAPIAEAPIKVLSSIGDSVRRGQERKGLKSHVEDGWNDMADYRGRRERGERMGLFSTKDKDGNKVGKGVFGRVNDMYFNKEAREDARYGPKGASYAREEDARIAKRNAEQAEKFAQKRAAIEEKERKLAVRRKAGYKFDYDNFDENGNNISRIYNITKSNRGYNHFMKQDGESKRYKRSIEDHIGFGLHELLQANPEGFDAGNLSKAQRKIISKAIKSGLTGNALKQKFGIKDQVKEEESVATASSEGKGAPEAITGSIESMTSKLSEVMKEVSPKEQIEKSIAPKIQETNNKLTEIASKIGDVLGTASRTFKVKKSGGSTSNIPRHLGGDQSPGTDEEETVDADYQAYHDRMRKRHGMDKQDKGSLLARIAADVRVVASEVKGQLDGVGSNVFKIRKIVQHSNGMEDGDITGSANRDRIGFMGKLRRMMFRPFDAIREKITNVIGAVTQKLTAFTKGLVNVTKTIVMVPVNIAKGIGKGIASVVKGVGKTIQLAATELIKLPGKLVKVVGSAVEAVGHVVKAFGPAMAKVLEGAAGLLSGAAKGLGAVFKGVGKGIGAFAENFGKSVGNIVGVLGTTTTKLIGSIGTFITKSASTLVSLGSSLLSSAGKLITGTSKMLVDFSLKTIAGVGEVVKTVGRTMLDIVTSPLKFLSKGIGKLIGKGKQEVVVTGGTLDVVKQVDLVKSMDSTKGKKDHSTSVVVTGLGESVIHAISDAVRHAMHSLLPFPVFMVGGHGPFGGGPSGGGGGGGFPGGRNTGRFRSGSLTNTAMNAFAGARGLFRGARGGVGAIRGAMGSAKAGGGFRGALGGAFNGFINSRRNALPVADRAADMNVLASGAGNIIPFGSGGGPALNLLNGAHKFGSSKAFLSKVPGYDTSNLLNGNNPMDNKLSYMKSFVTRRNVNHEMAIQEERQEKASVAGFRIANIGLLSMIESNTRRMADMFDDIFGRKGLLTLLLGEFLKWFMDWLRKLRLPDFTRMPGFGGGCCGGGGTTVINNTGGGTVVNNTGGGAGTTGAGGNTTVLTTPGQKIPGTTTTTTGKPGTGTSPVRPTGPVVLPFPGNKPVTTPNKPVPATPAKPVGPKVVPGKPATVPSPAPVIPFPGQPKETPAKPAAPQPLAPTGTKNGKVYQFPNQPKVEKVPVQQPLPKVVGGNMTMTPGGFKPTGGMNGPVMSMGGNNGGNVYQFPGTGSSNVGPTNTGGSGGRVYQFPGGSNQAPPSTGGSVYNMSDYMPNGGNNNNNSNEPVRETRTSRRQAQEAARRAGRGRGIKGLLGTAVQGVANFFTKEDKVASRRISGGNVLKFPGAQGAPTPSPTPAPQAGGSQTVRRPMSTLGGLWDAGKSLVTGGAKGIGKAGGAIKGLFTKGGGSNVTRMPRSAGQIAKGAVKGAGGMLAKGGGLLARVAGNVPLLNLATAGINAANTRGRANEIFGVAEGEEATKGQKLAATIGGGAIGYIPGVGLIDYMTGGKISDFASKGLYKAGTAVGNAWDATKNVAGKAWEGTKAVGGAMWDGAKFLGNAAVTGTKALAGKAWEGAKNLGGKAADFLGVSKDNSFAQNAWNVVKNGSPMGLAAKGLGKANEMMGDPLGKAKEGIQQMAESLGKSVDDIKNKTADVWNSTKDAIGTKWEETKTKFSETVDNIKTKTADVWNSTKEAIGTKWEETKTKFSETVDSIKTKTADVWNSTKEAVSNKWDETKTKFSETVDSIKSKTSAVWTSVKETAGKKWDEAKKSVVEKVTNIASKTKTAWDSMKTTASKKWDETKKNVTDKVTAMATDAKNKWESAKKVASEKLTLVKTHVSEKAKAMADTAKEKWEAAKGAVSDKLGGLAKTAGEKAKGMVTAVGDALEGAKSAISSGLSSLASKAQSIWDKITGGKGPGTGGPIEPKDGPGVGGALAPWEAFGSGNTKNGMVYYSQNDPRWANKSFMGKGKGMNFAKAGCGPTSAAMVLSSVTGQEINPMETLKYAQENGFTDATRGTRSDFFASVGAQYGVNMVQTGNDADAIKQQLAMNRPVILRGEGGKAYTKGGHYIVATGLTKDGKIKVNDPMSKQRSVAYDANTLMKNTTSGFVARKGFAAPTFGNGVGAITPSMQNGAYGAGSTSGNGVFAGWRITSPYGYRNDPGDGSWKMHRGIDIVKYNGYPIPSFTNGTVVYSGWGANGSGYGGGYGNVVAIKDERGYTHLYAHLSAVKVRVGQKIKKGTVVGLQGNTGRSFGSHLHYEVRKGGYGTDVNPGKYLESYVANKDFVADPTADLGADAGVSIANIGPAPSPLLNMALSAVTGSSSSEGVLSGISGFFSKLASRALFGEQAEAATDSSGFISPDPAGKVSGNDVAAKVWNILASKKMSAPAIAGILGNLQQESTMDPTKLQAGGKKGTGAGLAQWTIGGRWDVLQNFAKSKGLSPWSAEAQAEFIWHELNYKGYPWGSPAELNKRGVADAAVYFSQKFERPAAWAAHNDKRSNYAQQWFDKLSKSGGKGIGGPTDELVYGSGSNPEIDPNGLLYGIGESILSRTSTPTNKAASNRSLETVGAGYTESYMTQKSSEMGMGGDSELMVQAVELLKQISQNTKTTSDGVQSIYRHQKSTPQEEKKEDKDSNLTVNNSNSSYNANPVLGAMNDAKSSKQQKDYRIAKTIAGSVGRI